MATAAETATWMGAATGIVTAKANKGNGKGKAHGRNKVRGKLNLFNLCRISSFVGHIK